MVKIQLKCAEVENYPEITIFDPYFSNLVIAVGFGDGHFLHAMRWRCFIFYNDAISIIFGHSLPSPSLRLFFQTIEIDYFAMFV